MTTRPQGRHNLKKLGVLQEDADNGILGVRQGEVLGVLLADASSGRGP